MNKFLRFTIVSALSAVLLTGCGWHLRGHNAALVNVQSAHVSARNLQSDLVVELKRSLAANNIATPNSATDAQYSIVILNQHSERRVATVTASARVAEYRLTEEVDVLILDANGEPALPRTTLSAELVFEFDEDNVHAKDDEERLLKAEMRSTLIRQIVDLLRVASRNAIAPAANATED